MKTVFVDLLCSQPVSGSKFHGGGEYTKTIFRALTEYHGREIQLNVFYNPEEFIDDWILQLIEEKNIGCYKIAGYSDVSCLPNFQTTDVFFAGLIGGLSKLKIPKGMRVIATYHGYRSLEMPSEKYASLYESSMKGILKEKLKYWGRTHYIKRKKQQIKTMLEPCTDLIADSEHSRYATKNFFGDLHKPIYVFYPPQKYVEIPKLIDYSGSRPTILMLGGNRWVKNCYRGLKALDELFFDCQLEDYAVEVIGGIPARIKKRLHNTERFISEGYLSPADLERKYQMCDFFFYPTLNEGFGSPPLEAMKYGKTCVISGVSSLTEIYRDSVYYCNPWDIQEMKTRLLQAATDKISQDQVGRAHQRITERWQKDLQTLCEMIVREGGEYDRAR